MMQSDGMNHATTSSRSGTYGSQFCFLNQSQPSFPGLQFNQFDPSHFYQAQPHFVGPLGPVHQFAPEGVAQHLYSEGFTHQHLGLA